MYAASPDHRLPKHTETGGGLDTGGNSLPASSQMERAMWVACHATIGTPGTHIDTESSAVDVEHLRRCSAFLRARKALKGTIGWNNRELGRGGGQLFLRQLEEPCEIQDELEGVAAGYPLTEYHIHQAARLASRRRNVWRPSKRPPKRN
jgi:hypothetical protein